MDSKYLLNIFDYIAPNSVAILQNLDDNVSNDVYIYFEENNVDYNIMDMSSFFEYGAGSVESNSMSLDLFQSYDVVLINGYKNWSFVREYFVKLGDNFPFTILVDFKDYYNKELYKLNTLNIIGEAINNVQEKILFYSFDISYNISIISINNSRNYDILMNYQKNNIIYGFINSSSSYAEDNSDRKEIFYVNDYDYLYNDSFLEDDSKEDVLINDLKIKNYNFYHMNKSLKDDVDILSDTNKMFLRDISELRGEVANLKKYNDNYVEQLSDKDNQLNNLHNEVDKQNSELLEMKQKISSLEKDKTRLLSSRSWKLTSPLRKLSKMFSKE